MGYVILMITISGCFSEEVKPELVSFGDEMPLIDER